MNDLRVGMLFRAVRRKRRLRQTDVAAASGVSQSVISRLERGCFDSLALRTIRRVGECLEIDLPFAPRHRGGEGDRLLDERHACLVNTAVSALRWAGWHVVVEYSYSEFGERGSVDVLAWREDQLAVVVCEIKTELTDHQQMLRSMDVKRRLVPRLLERELHWRARHVALLLVLEDQRSLRASIERHADIFGAAFPARTIAARHFIAEPSGSLAAIWFLQLSHGGTAKRRPPTPKRVRRPHDGSDSGS